MNALAQIRSITNGATAYIISASDDGTARVWVPRIRGLFIGTQTINTQPVFLYRGHQGKVNAVAALPHSTDVDSPLSPLVATASDDQTVQIWNLYGYPVTTTYKEHHAPVKALAASLVDHRMVSGDADGLVHLWTTKDPSYR